MTTEPMSRLNTATSFHCNAVDNNTPVKVTYKTGASFVGKVEDYKKTGSGVFIWPDGSKYDGDYVNNLRHGTGVQTWADKTLYEGGFVNDLRHGQGSIQWADGETYKGSFFKDRRHGKGTYTWPNGSSFTGTFYMDKKEGYGVFTFASGNKFEGLYKDDEREGPGVMTYKDGRQDVGFWHGERLRKLLTAVSGAFTMGDHPEVKYQPEDMNIPIVPRPDKTEPLKNVLEPPALFRYTPEVKVTRRISELYSEDLDPRSLAVNREAFDDEFFKDNSPSDEPEPTSLLAWNKSPQLVQLQMHTHKHRKAAQSVHFPVHKVLNFDRSGFNIRGPLELASEELIKMAAAGNFLRVEELLNGGSVHPDVADSNGHTALIGATVNWHLDTINVLLNHGADVNQLNDEGVSALAAGTIFYYPVESFHCNIAERYLDKPTLEDKQDTRSEQSQSPSRGHSVTAPVPTSLSKAERRASQLNQLNRKKSEMAALRNSKDSETIRESEVIEEENSGPPKSTKRDSQVVLSDITPVKITVAKSSRTQLPKGEEDKRVDNYKGSVISDDDHDSVLNGDELEDQGNEVEVVRDKEEFESNISVHNYQIEVTDSLLERCATQLSMNERVVSREAARSDMGRARMLAIQISQHERMKDTLELLLKRGADPNASQVPMPVLFFAIKSADVDMVRTLLMKGASTAARLSHDKGGLAPLHIAVAIPGEEGVAITDLLLNALADPDVRATEDDSFLNRTLEEEWSKDVISPESQALLGGRTPLQIACARDDHYKNACKVVQLLLKHKANPDLMCNGFSALALAITSGNDLAIDELLVYNANPSLPLTHGVGSALCVASSTEYEHRRSIQGRIQLIDQLIRAGADILAPIAIGPKRVMGTAVDYAYYMFNQPESQPQPETEEDGGPRSSFQEAGQLSVSEDGCRPVGSENQPSDASAGRAWSFDDRRIAHMPYHALTHAERETYNARRKLLAHIGDILRTKAVDREKRRLIEEEERGVRSASPSQSFVFMGAGAPLPPGVKGKAAAKAGQVTFEPGAKDGKERKGGDVETTGGVRSGVISIVAKSASEVKRLAGQSRPPARKPLFKYCYDCGRSVGVRLSACTRCKEVFYCSKACKLKAWNARHKEECVRVGGRSPSPRESRTKKLSESPTAASQGGDAREKKNLRIQSPGADVEKTGQKSKTQAGRPQSAPGDQQSKDKKRSQKGEKKGESGVPKEKSGAKGEKKVGSGVPDKTSRAVSRERKVSQGRPKSSDDSKRKSAQTSRPKSAEGKKKLSRLEMLTAKIRQEVQDRSTDKGQRKEKAHKLHRQTQSVLGAVGGPARGLSLSAYRSHQGLRSGDSRYVQLGDLDGANKPFQTEDGRWVYIDNYSYN